MDVSSHLLQHCGAEGDETLHLALGGRMKLSEFGNFEDQDEV
jgi:hypothetical protein